MRGGSRSRRALSALAVTAASIVATSSLASCDFLTGASPGVSGTSASTPVESPSSGAPTPQTSASSPGSDIPFAMLSADLGSPGGSEPAAPLTKSVLTTLLSESLTDAGSGAISTVVCDGDLARTGGQGVSCTATTTGSGNAFPSTWMAYATHGPGGAPAVLWLAGAPLSAEFATLIAAPSTTVAAASVGPGFGTSPRSDADVAGDAQAVLARSGSPVALTSCEGTLTFHSFEPVACSGTAAGAPARSLVLPGSLLGQDPGLIVVSQPA